MKSQRTGKMVEMQFIPMKIDKFYRNYETLQQNWEISGNYLLEEIVLIKSNVIYIYVFNSLNVTKIKECNTNINWN